MYMDKREFHVASHEMIANSKYNTKTILKERTWDWQAYHKALKKKLLQCQSTYCTMLMNDMNTQS